MQSRKPGTFTSGNKASVGNKGGGRTPDWLKAKCQALIDKHKLIEFLADVARGQCLERALVLNAGKEVLAMKSCDPETRMKAIGMLLERGFGKASQPLEHSGEVGGKMIIVRPGK